MTVTAEMRRGVPEPLYACKNDYCATEHTFPAQDMFWVQAEPGDAHGSGFYCYFCIDEMPQDPGPSLAETLETAHA